MQGNWVKQDVGVCVCVFEGHQGDSHRQCKETHNWIRFLLSHCITAIFCPAFHFLTRPLFVFPSLSLISRLGWQSLSVMFSVLFGVTGKCFLPSEVRTGTVAQSEGHFTGQQLESPLSSDWEHFNQMTHLSIPDSFKVHWQYVFHWLTVTVFKCNSICIFLFFSRYSHPLSESETIYTKLRLWHCPWLLLIKTPLCLLQSVTKKKKK